MLADYFGPVIVSSGCRLRFDVMDLASCRIVGLHCCLGLKVSLLLFLSDVILER